MSKPLRILLVEDNPGDADLIQELLPANEYSGFTVCCVNRLADAISHLRNNETDLALLDLDLPDSQGIDTVRRAHQAAPKIPIVVLTGHQDERMGIEALEVGAQDFLVKGQTHRSHIARVIRYAVQRKRAEEEKLRLAAQLRHARKIEAIGILAGGIAHDFNNILSSVLGFTELSLMDAPPGSDLENNLQNVFQAGMRAKQLVQRILTFAREDEFKTQPTQISAIAREASKLIRSIIPSSIEIRLKVESDASVMADPAQIHQIFMNLFTNAAQAMEADGGELRIHISECPRSPLIEAAHPSFTPNGFLKITVADTGVGIPSELLEKIFDPYFTTKGMGEGTGLGLSVVHGIVQASGGKIKVESRPGRGTTFSIYLPLSHQASDTAVLASGSLPVGTERILFVDDEKSLADMSRKRLSLLGYRVTAVSNSLDALNLMTENPDDFDLVITDMTMPGMSGDQLVLEARKRIPGIPAILCTGFSKKISKEKAVEMGIDAFIMKPVTITELAGTIRRVLDKGEV